MRLKIFSIKLQNYYDYTVFNILSLKHFVKKLPEKKNLYSSPKYLLD